MNLIDSFANQNLNQFADQDTGWNLGRDDSQNFLACYPQLSCRLAKSKDAAAIAELDLLCFGKQAWSVQTFAEEIVRSLAADIVGRRFLAVIEEDIGLGRSRLVSAICVRIDEVSELLTISTHPAWRRHGFARNLLQIAIDKATESGSKEMWLEVRSKDLGAQNLYRQMGFEKRGLRRKYYGDDDAITMCLSLVL